MLEFWLEIYQHEKSITVIKQLLKFQSMSKNVSTFGAATTHRKNINLQISN